MMLTKKEKGICLALLFIGAFMLMISMPVFIITPFELDNYYRDPIISGLIGIILSIIGFLLVIIAILIFLIIIIKNKRGNVKDDV